MNIKLIRILQKIKEYEKKTPYNYCDRWCERCDHETQLRCNLYKDELECKLNCIGNGRDENDPEITAAVMKQQFKEAFEGLEGTLEEIDIEMDETDNDEAWERVKEHVRFVSNNSLTRTSKKYSALAHDFLKKNYYKKKDIKPEIKDPFEVVSWYHSLLPVKVNRALAGFHEPMLDGDISLYDVVGQFQICKKAVRKSMDAFDVISRHMPAEKDIPGMKALLGNINSRIDILLKNI
ncbi:MAG: hypothetical protein P9L88_04485 [Candidatus Tantalella remota]|nr:hypothetical protein [Candidatus Tantalella remota]